MSIYHINDVSCLKQLFNNWQETMIWSCLQGVMGNAWADDISKPKSAQIVIADFCFFAGEPNIELVRNKPEDRKSDFIIMVGQNSEWEELIEKTYTGRAKKITRYAIKKEPDAFDIEKLKDIVNRLQEPYRIKLIDGDAYNQIMNNQWSRDLCSQFQNYRDFMKHGVGVVATDNGTVVSRASSYTVYKEGIEIEVDTRSDHRRKGLALACGAKLIIECLERGLYPSWDAQNMGSVALAEKLGYHFDKEYTAYEVVGY